MKIEHLGIACRSVEKSVVFYRDVLGLPVVSEEIIDTMALRVIKIQAAEVVLELLEPLEGEKVVSKFLASRGEGIHHLCLAVDDLEETLTALRTRGYTPIWEEPRIGAGGKRVNFLRPGDTSGILIELSQG